VNKVEKVGQESKKLSQGVGDCNDLDCNTCCLSNNRCGTEEQCYRSKFMKRIFDTFFYFLLGFFIVLFIIRWNQIDGTQEHKTEDKLDKKCIHELIKMYSNIRKTETNVFNYTG
jgi:hypothetical protein